MGKLRGALAPLLAALLPAPAAHLPRPGAGGRLRRFLCSPEHREALVHPGGRRRTDLQPPHHAPLRDRAGPPGGPGPAPRAAPARAGQDEELPRDRTADGPREGPAGRPLVDRRHRLLPHVYAREPVRRAALQPGQAGPPRPARPDRPGRPTVAESLAQRAHPPVWASLHGRRARTSRHRGAVDPRSLPDLSGTQIWRTLQAVRTVILSKAKNL